MMSTNRNRLAGLVEELARLRKLEAEGSEIDCERLDDLDAEIKAFTFDASEIESVYTGANRKCCCGCSGTHFSDGRNIKRVVKLIEARIAAGAEIDVYGRYAAVENEPRTRVYIAYWKDTP